MVKTKLLVVDDEASIRRMLRSALPEEEYETIEAATGREGIRAIALHNPKVVIFDLGLPDMDGVECIKEVRQWSEVPIIVLSARGEEKVKIAALDAGAHDYVVKPFSMGELMARIKVALRLRNPAAEQGSFEFAQLSVDPAAHLVTVRGEQVHLTPLEFKLLLLLARNAGRVLTHRQIISDVWGPAYAGETHYLRILMKSLRHKIEVDPARPSMLITETGVGYRFQGE